VAATPVPFAAATLLLSRWGSASHVAALTVSESWLGVMLFLGNAHGTANYAELARSLMHPPRQKLGAIGYGILWGVTCPIIVLMGTPLFAAACRAVYGGGVSVAADAVGVIALTAAMVAIGTVLGRAAVVAGRAGLVAAANIGWGVVYLLGVAFLELGSVSAVWQWRFVSIVALVSSQLLLAATYVLRGTGR
jgi:hypothetical protein